MVPPITGNSFALMSADVLDASLLSERAQLLLAIRLGAVSPSYSESLDAREIPRMNDRADPADLSALLGRADLATARPGETITLALRIVNHLRTATMARAELRLPEGWTGETLANDVAIGGGAQGDLRFRVRAPEAATVGERHVITATVTLGERRFGPVAEGIIQVVPGQTVKVNVIVANHGAAEIAIKQVGFAGFQSNASCAMTAFTPGFFFPGGGRGRPSTGSGQVVGAAPNGCG